MKKTRIMKTVAIVLTVSLLAAMTAVIGPAASAANEYTVFNCDSSDSEIIAYTVSGSSVSTLAGTFKEGTGSINLSTTSTVKTTKFGVSELAASAGGMSINGCTVENTAVKFWLYVGNLSNINRVKVAAGNCTADTYYKYIKTTTSDAPLTAGWKEYEIPISSMLSTGTPDVSNLTYFYFEIGTKGGYTSAVYLDDVRISTTDTGITTSHSGLPTASIVTPTYDEDDVIVADVILSSEYGFAIDNTGVKDATAVINRALGLCSSMGGGTVWLPAGKYLVTGVINVPSFVTLRGNYRDPDTVTDGNYGTMIVARPDVGTNLFQILGAGACMGLTVYYPDQNIVNPVEYGYTFFMPNGARYLASVINCTVLNAYKGVGSYANSALEMMSVEGFKGTVLCEGVASNYSADVDTYTNITISPRYWIAAGAAYNCPAATQLRTYTKANVIGIAIADVEWPQYLNITVDYAKYGIYTFRGYRATVVQPGGWPNGVTSGTFENIDVRNTQIAFYVTSQDTRWEFVMANAYLDGDSFDIKRVLSSGTTGGAGLRLSNVTCAHNTISYGTATVYKSTNDELTAGVSEAAGTKSANPKAVLYNVKNYGEYQYGNDQNITTDDSDAIQDALDAAHAAGGGVVYLPAGWYRINKALTVYADTELRGCASSPTRDQAAGGSNGTVIYVYYGLASSASAAYSSTAAVTVEGDNAGVSGIRFVYPENGNADSVSDYYSFTVRANGTNNFIENCCFVGVWNGVDFRNADSFHIKKCVGAFYGNAFVVGGKGGVIEGCLTNPNMFFRHTLAVGSGWYSDEASNLQSGVVNSMLHNTLNFITFEDAYNVTSLNNFAYGPKYLFTFNGGSDNVIVNSGDDNNGSSGFPIRYYNGDFTVVNLMRWTNGSNGLQYTVATGAAEDNCGTLNIINTVSLNSVSDSDVIRNVEHETMGAWTLITEATPEHDGCEARTCPVCGHTEYRTVAYVFIAGDADANKVLGVADALLILRYVAKYSNLDIHLDFADYNDDNVVNILDAKDILVYLASQS